jgi:hypothetical protein
MSTLKNPVAPLPAALTAKAAAAQKTAAAFSAQASQKQALIDVCNKMGGT